MNRNHDFSIDEYYHVYNRGVDKRVTFQNKYDYHRFMLLLYFCNSTEPVDMEKIFRKGRTFTDIFNIEKGRSLVAIGAWCLMPNHFHILLKEITENGIIKFMQKLTTGYSMYFNKKYTRSGSLFQGKFKSEHIQEDRYLKYIFSYIHLNPIKLIPEESKWKENGIRNKQVVENFLKNYEYSSLKNYINSDAEYENILDKKVFPNYFPTINEQIEEIEEWLNYTESAVVKVRPSQK
ncbi:transposase [Candidatus Nomurabacteria bacterium]|nr:transposase [Candidatus Nomurabacteria bacterium]